jgi:hypothetical protein
MTIVKAEMIMVMITKRKTETRNIKIAENINVAKKIVLMKKMKINRR